MLHIFRNAAFNWYTDNLYPAYTKATPPPAGALHEVVNMMSLTPARLLRKDAHKGSISIGKDADLLLFDEQINIQLAMARGTVCRPNSAAFIG